MEDKVLLYDSNNVKIGETFVRRARQLVKQQRASWTDDSQNAIRFAPGMENPDDVPAVMHSSVLDKELMKLAKRRVHAKFAFRLHTSITLVLSAFLVIIYLLTDRGGYFWPVWPIFGLGLGVAIHGMIYKIITGSDMDSKIALEYERLKLRHSYVDYEDKRK